MGIPIRLSADFLTKTLQARREWHGIFKVMKGKNLQPRILYSARLLQIWWRNQKLFRQAKVKRIQHNQTSITTNAKGTYLGRKHRRRKRPAENKPRAIKKTVTGSHISIITWNVNGLMHQAKDIDWLGGWKHVHVCTSNYYITLLNLPNCMELFYIIRLIMFPL